MGVDPERVRIWAHAWARSRSAAPPTHFESGWYIHVGQPDQLARYVFPSLDTQVIAQVVEAVRQPAIFLKVCGDPERVRSLLPPEWELRPPGFFMHIGTERMDADPGLPSGYRLTFAPESYGVRAILSHAGDEVAAEGRLILEQGWGIFDRISTSEAHRRRGCATAIMRALQREALRANVAGGMLVATVAGRQLYESMGWTRLSDYVTAAIAG